MEVDHLLQHRQLDGVLLLANLVLMLNRVEEKIAGILRIPKKFGNWGVLWIHFTRLPI